MFAIFLLISAPSVNQLPTDLSAGSSAMYMCR
jgi:hypothetical protein